MLFGGTILLLRVNLPQNPTHGIFPFFSWLALDRLICVSRLVEQIPHAQWARNTAH